MTLTEILASLYRRLDYASSPASDVTTRLKELVNQTQRQMLSHPALPSLRDDTITFASVAGQTRYGLPPAIAQIQAITDRTTSLRLRLIPPDELRNIDPGLLDSATPVGYTPWGQQAVAVQPSAACEVFVKSTSASDTGTAYIEGIRTGGYPVTRSVTMTGATAVSLGSAFTDIVEVTKFYLSTAAVGTVTLHADSGVGDELARIAIGQAFSRYQSIQLWPTPQAALTYWVDYMRVVPDLINGTDEPLLPNDFHWLLVEGTLAIEWARSDDTRRSIAEASFNKGMRHLINRVANPPDFLPVMGGRNQELSRLGRWFPDGAGVR